MFDTIKRKRIQVEKWRLSEHKHAAKHAFQVKLQPEAKWEFEEF